MIEALKKMYQLLLTEPHAPAVCDQLEPMLREAIAELESQEPVGRFAKFTDGVWRPVTDYSAGVPLYTTPPQRTWVGLTDEEAQWLYDNCRTPSNLIDMVEAKLKEKNT